MIRLKDTRFPHTAALLTSAIEIAEYYGFVPMESLPRAQAAALKKLPSVSKVESEVSFARRDERTLLSAARRCLAGMMSGSGNATLAWRTVPSTAGIPSVSLELHVVGPGSAIAEALLMVIGNAVVEEAGIGARALSINNLGSQESSGRYVRDVGMYLRKHLESISPTLRPRAASDPLGTLIQLIERGHPAMSRAPQAMEYLTEEERRRFWELLEYLEMSSMPYELNPQVLGSRDFWSHALFEISSADTETGARVPLMSGGRYDPLASRLLRAPARAAMISITCEVRGKTRIRRREPAPQGAMQPAIYFTHLGVEARRRALPVLETLRKSGIRVHQNLWRERIGEQMTTARELAVPYILIMGHKEAMEGTILVREVATNSQDAVPVAELPQYLKKRRVGAGKSEAHT